VKMRGLEISLAPLLANESSLNESWRVTFPQIFDQIFQTCRGGKITVIIILLLLKLILYSLIFIDSREQMYLFFIISHIETDLYRNINNI